MDPNIELKWFWCPTFDAKCSKFKCLYFKSCIKIASFKVERRPLFEFTICSSLAPINFHSLWPTLGNSNELQPIARIRAALSADEPSKLVKDFLGIILLIIQDGQLIRGAVSVVRWSSTRKEIIHTEINCLVEKFFRFEKLRTMLLFGTPDWESEKYSLDVQSPDFRPDRRISKIEIFSTLWNSDRAQREYCCSHWELPITKEPLL